MDKWNELEEDIVKEKIESLGDDLVQEARKLGIVISEILQATADSRLKLLREIDESCAFCPLCMSHKISTVGEKIHKDNCKLEEELGE